MTQKTHVQDVAESVIVWNQCFALEKKFVNRGIIMGIRVNYMCENCDFEFQTDDVMFHINQDGKLEEYLLLMMTCSNGRGSKINGYVFETICLNCGKTIKTYRITHNEYDQDEAFEIVKHALDEKNDMILRNGGYHLEIEDYAVYLTDYFGDGYEYDFDDYDSKEDAIAEAQKEIDRLNEKLAESMENTVYNIVIGDEENPLEIINCPNCNDELPISFEGQRECPKCGGLLLGFDMLLD